MGLIEFTCSPMAVHLPAAPQPSLVDRLAALPLAVLDTRTARESHVVVPLRTERLRLRLVNAADVPDLQAHWNDRDVRRHLFGGSEVTREFASHLVAAAQEAAEQHDGVNNQHESTKRQQNPALSSPTPSKICTDRSKISADRSNAFANRTHAGKIELSSRGGDKSQRGSSRSEHPEDPRSMSGGQVTLAEPYGSSAT